MIAELEGARDVSMRHPARQLDLGFEELQRLCRVCAMRVEKLERHVFVELAIVGAKDRAHTAGAEHFFQEITTGDQLAEARFEIVARRAHAHK